MPRAPLRPCTEPGCPTLTKQGRCPEHQPVREKDPAQAKFYGSTRWKKLRALVRAQEPLCRMCQRKPTAVVDHVDGDWTNNERENLQGLCVDCNATKTAHQHREKRG